MDLKVLSNMAYKYSTVAFLQMIKESTIATWFVCLKNENT